MPRERRVGDVDVVVADGDVGDDLQRRRRVEHRPVDRVGEQADERVRVGDARRSSSRGMAGVAGVEIDRRRPLRACRDDRRTGGGPGDAESASVSVSVGLAVAAVRAADGGLDQARRRRRRRRATSGSSAKPAWPAAAARASAACGRPGAAAAEVPRDRLADERRADPRSEMSIDVHVIDDADDRGVDGRRLLPERLAGGAPFEHDQHLLVHAGADAVDRQQRRARAACRRR